MSADQARVTSMQCVLTPMGPIPVPAMLDSQEMDFYVKVVLNYYDCAVQFSWA